MTKRTTPLATPLPNTLTANKFYLHTGLVFPLPDRFCNASMPNTDPEKVAKAKRPPARPGAEQFLQYESFGTRC